MAYKYTDTGLVKTGQNSAVAEDSLSDSGRLQAESYALSGGGSEEPAAVDNERYSRLPSSGVPNSVIPDYNTPVTGDALKLLTDVSPYDEDSRRREMYNQAQANLSGINAIYDRQVESEREFGKRDLARANTISAITGMMGSPIATTAAGKSDERTASRIAAVNEARAMRINAIYDRIDENIVREKEARMQTNRENAKNLLDIVSKNAQETLAGLAQQGIDWDDFKSKDPQTLNTIIRQTGKSEFALRSIYNDSLPAEHKPMQYTDYRDNGDGTTTMIRVSFNPLTKKTSKEEYKMDAPFTLFKGEQKPIITDGKVLVKQADGSYVNVAPMSEKDIADIEYKKSQTAKNYADADDTDKNDYQYALDIVAQNPDASREELENAIRANTKGLSETDIERAIGRIINKNDLRLATVSDPTVVRDYFEANYDKDEIEKMAAKAGYKKGGFLGMGVGKKGINDYLSSDEAIDAYVDAIIEQYQTSGYSIR